MTKGQSKEHASGWRESRHRFSLTRPAPLELSSPGLTGRSSTPCRKSRLTNDRCELLDASVEPGMTIERSLEEAASAHRSSTCDRPQAESPAHLCCGAMLTVHMSL